MLVRTRINATTKQTLKKVNIPELADVGVALVQVVHAHPSWGCCWVVLRGDVPEQSTYF